MGACQRAALCILGVEEPQIVVALADADHHCFVIHPRHAALALLPAADVSNIYFNFTVEHGLVGLCHSMTNAMAQIPESFRARELSRASASQKTRPVFRRKKVVVLGMFAEEGGGVGTRGNDEKVVGAGVVQGGAGDFGGDAATLESGGHLGVVDDHAAVAEAVFGEGEQAVTGGLEAALRFVVNDAERIEVEAHGARR